MFEIFNDHITAHKAPHESHISRISRKSGKLKKITMFSNVGEEWSLYANVLKDAGVDELEVFCGNSKINFKWLREFSFISKLYLHSSFLPEIKTLEYFNSLKELGLGNGTSKKVNDLSEVAFLFKGLQSLTLSGSWKNCNIVTSYELVNLSISKFKPDDDVFLSGSDIESLVIHSCEKFSFENIKGMQGLKIIEILSKVDSSNLPDLSNHKALEKVFFENEGNLQDFKNILSPSVAVTLF